MFFFIFHISVSQLLEAFVKKYGGSATYVSRAPGRVNLIGMYVYLKAYMCFPEVFHCRESFRENHFSGRSTRFTHYVNPPSAVNFNSFHGIGANFPVYGLKFMTLAGTL